MDGAAVLPPDWQQLCSLRRLSVTHNVWNFRWGGRAATHR